MRVIIGLGTKWILVAVILLFNTVVQENLAQYVPPTPSVEPLYPRGLRMSVPHEDGISLVAYHVKINEDFNGLEAGTIARDITRIRNGHWTYEDHSTRIKRGDIIYYWIHVVYDGLGYNLLDQHHIANVFYNYDGTLVEGTANKNISCSILPQTKIYENGQLRQQNVCPGQLIFEDNFDTVDTSRWTIVERFPIEPYYDFVVYMNNNTNVQVEGGILNVKPVLTNDKYGPQFVRDGSLTLQRCTGEANTDECQQSGRPWRILPPVISGRINTKSSFNFMHGRIEIRAKLPRGDWIYPSITLEKTETQKNSLTFIDILVAYSAGNPNLELSNGVDASGRVLLSGPHAITQSGNILEDNAANLLKKTSNSLWSNDYHVYELEWTRGQIKVKVDGEQYGEQNAIPTLFDVPMYLNLGVAVGGHIMFPNNIKCGNYVKPWKNFGAKALHDFCNAENNWRESWNQDPGLHVDYIKVWAV